MLKTALVVVWVVLLAACGGADHPTGLSDDDFIATVVELRRAALETPGSYAALKEQILARRNVTEEQLRAYIQSHTSDLDHLAEVWQAVNDSMSVPDPI